MNESVFSLAATRALVVGGSGGIGAAVAMLLAAEGSHVVCHGARAERVERTVAEIRAGGGEASAFPWEITTVAPFVSALEARFPTDSFDIVVAAYGPVVYAPLGETTVDEWERMALHNAALPGALASIYVPAMVGRGRGRFVLFGGTDTGRIRPFRTLSAYGAMKTAVTALCRSAARTAAGSNVSVFLCLPGFVDTEYVTAAERARMTSLAPGGQLDSPSEVARAVVTCIGERADSTNGRTFFVGKSGNQSESAS